MKRLVCLFLTLLLVGALTVTAYADILLPLPDIPDKPDSSGKPDPLGSSSGNSVITHLMHLLLPLVLILSLLTIMVFLIKNLIKSTKRT